MRIFAGWLIAIIVCLTVLAAFSVSEGVHAAAIGAAGFVALLLALCFYALADIRQLFFLWLKSNSAE